MITIRQPLCFSEIGLKDNQEDYLYPQGADTGTRVFLMCDGMGGHDKGEVASRTAATAMGRYLCSRLTVDVPTFEAALGAGYDALDDIDTGSAHKPGTTMTCLCLNDDSYLVAHIGDSRIYHIRPSLYDASTHRGGVIYQSTDHSLVNDLIRAGELTEEQARTFGQRNVITRAMQPHLETRFRADIYMFDDIAGGDYFFLCSDGVLEQLTRERLCEILADTSTSDREKMRAIQDVCSGRTRDNYTCWLVPIDEAEIRRREATTQVIKAEEVGEEENGIVTAAETGIITGPIEPRGTARSEAYHQATAQRRDSNPSAPQRLDAQAAARRPSTQNASGHRTDAECQTGAKREIVIKVPLSLTSVLRKVCLILAALILLMVLLWIGMKVVDGMRTHVPALDTPTAIENIAK